ncbi:unnamed protein product [Mytilus edulis]|uniref:Methyltransferase FkbM domain-containing protein n=1 Tax=Mytilus edulis TaxID=6550 RepID=A0A8S3QMK5_MYTED|nr:unnamed protein product [Mytilus edulis]
MDYLRSVLKLSPAKKYFIVIIVIFISFLKFIHVSVPYYCQSIQPRKVIYECFEDPATMNRTGIEDVIPLDIHQRSETMHKTNSDMPAFSKRNFTMSEEKHIKYCIKNYAKDIKKGGQFWKGTQYNIRFKEHRYLVPNKSIIVDIGGNIGGDAQSFLDMYNPQYYIILEPLKLFYRKLNLRFKDRRNVMIVYNIGLGAKYEIFMIKIEGNVGVATSSFSGSGKGSCSLKVVNALDFYKLGVWKFSVDLVTMNCEGCEYDLLENILSSNLIHFFKNIQFATHPTLEKLRDPIRRYCQLQEILHRTHKPTYQYKYVWESWKLK